MTIPSTHPFSTTVSIRITDINYGMHLSYTATIGLFHNARVLFMTANGFEDMDVGGCGLILINSQYSYNSEAKFNDTLVINVATSDTSKSRFSFVYQAVNQLTGAVVAEGKEEFACYDYVKRKVTSVPDRFAEFCRSNYMK